MVHERTRHKPALQQREKGGRVRGHSNASNSDLPGAKFRFEEACAATRRKRTGEHARTQNRSYVSTKMNAVGSRLRRTGASRLTWNPPLTMMESTKAAMSTAERMTAARLRILLQTLRFRAPRQPSLPMRHGQHITPQNCKRWRGAGGLSDRRRPTSAGWQVFQTQAHVFQNSCSYGCVGNRSRIQGGGSFLFPEARRSGRDPWPAKKRWSASLFLDPVGVSFPRATRKKNSLKA